MSKEKPIMVVGGIARRTLMVVYIASYIMTALAIISLAWEMHPQDKTDYDRRMVTCENGKTFMPNSGDDAPDLSWRQEDVLTKLSCQGYVRDGLASAYNDVSAGRTEEPDIDYEYSYPYKKTVGSWGASFKNLFGWGILTIIVFDVIKRIYRFIFFGKSFWRRK